MPPRKFPPDACGSRKFRSILIELNRPRAVMTMMVILLSGKRAANRVARHVS
jgi:hypothetical protein